MMLKNVRFVKGKVSEAIPIRPSQYLLRRMDVMNKEETRMNSFDQLSRRCLLGQTVKLGTAGLGVCCAAALPIPAAVRRVSH